MQAHSFNYGNAPVAIMGQKRPNAISPNAGGRNGIAPTQANAPVEAPRMLPDKDLKADSVEDDYVQFIFYCNPFIALSTATSELRRGFRSMPKTDGKSFDIFTLFELIRKLEAKEIETWSQLVVNMGVEPPDVSSGQSTQKVQQYAVRLKRWLHAFHVDAFFQYCLGKSNSYYTEIPTDPEITSNTIRDGVPPEEDLALRALVPEWRPKRGRRRNDETDCSPLAKRQLRAASLTADDNLSANPVSAYPQSASPWDRSSNQRDPWAAAHRAIAPRPDQAPTSTPQSAFDGGQLNFYMDLTDPAQHSQSATSTNPPISAYPTNTPQSAHPLSARPRKRHGPSVSAAWSNDSSSGKIRGRPSANRTVQDGPFSTFPAKQFPAPAMVTPTSATAGSAHPGSGGNPFSRSSPAATRKPSKLQLQVPQHSGGPVRLATPPPPPPKVLLNGTDGGKGQMERRSSADFFSTLDEEASEMGDTDDEEEGGDEGVDWKRRALALRRKVMDLESELKGFKKRVLEAIM